jgi:hypothetical protein
VALTASKNPINQPWRKVLKMSQMFTQLPSGCGKSASTGPKAVAPIIVQKKLEIAVAAGAAYQDLLPAIAAGECAIASGAVSNSGCAAIRLEISYLNDTNCDLDNDGCSDSALLPLEVEVLEFDIPANSAIDLPAGMVKGIKVATLDEFGGDLTANTAVQKVLFNSNFQPNACGCVLVP